jgi:phage terminase large subunit-like protein
LPTQTIRSPRSTSSRSDGRQELDLFAGFCRKALTLEDGSPLELHDFQRRMLSDLFDGVRETLILIPKKNGKSTLLGAIALYHLCTTPDAECVIAAASRDQAQIMLRQAQGFIRRSPSLQARLQVKQREIIHRSLGGRVRVLASDVDTADGVIPTLALVDELHRHKSSDLYGVFRDGLGPRDGRMVTISTAGDNEDSPLGVLRATAHAMPGLERDGAYRHVRSDGFSMHEWALDADQDRDDLELVKSANPAPWQTVEGLRERHSSPSMTPWQWARFACGVWGLGAQPAFDIDLWRSLAQPGKTIESGRLVTLGFDGSRRWDATALVATDVLDGHQVLVGAWERPPNAGEDWEVPEGEVDQAVAHAFETWDVWRMYADPPYWESAVDRWAGEHGEERVVRWWTNRLKATAFALRAWQTDMRPGVLSHDGDELLERHVGNAVRHATRMRDGDDELWVIRKDGQKSPRKIDAAMAACLSWEARGDAIRLGAEKKPSYGIATW